MGNTETSMNEKDDPESRIYEIVKAIYPEDCEKITGMLLEVDQHELIELLGDRDELQNRIHTAAKVVRQNSHPSAATHDIQIIGNKIYGTVQQLYPAFARQVTGMLLELGEERVVELLDNKNEFIEHIHKAAMVVMETERTGQTSRDHNKKTTQDSNRFSDTVSIEQQKEQLGDQIYLKVVSEYPDTASKITGMLLDMDIENLREISEDDDMLMEKVGEAVQVLEEDSCGDDGREESSQKKKELLQKQLNLELNLSNLQDKLDSLEDDLQK